MRCTAIESTLAHARDCAPNECCGLLVGRGDEIVEAVRARNIAADPARRFLVDPKDHFDGLRAARQRGLEVVGFYHSHPRSAAVPSETDVAEASYPDAFYLIVSLAFDPPEVALYRLERETLVRVPLRP